MAEIVRVARRELAAFFGSPVAYIFIGTFLAVSLFVFFWVDAFFARNIADARPLFEWMPILLIFLCAALTMRMWSEERRAGTLENLLTLPVATPKLVLGKFLAALGLVAVALGLTLPLPITVSLLGPLDWGPVLGAYLAALLLAAAYVAVGLFVSARTDNPIVALIGATLISAAFYVIGSPALTSLVGHSGGEFLRLLGTGARFESITRGVIDVRDLYYYLSLTGTFLALNIYGLERLRWAEPGANPRHHRRWTLVTGLAVANLIAANLWIQGITGARADLTEGRIYSLSEATQTYLSQLQEPLLIRGYFSAQTHPLLAPLVPQLRDLLEEYQVAGGDRVRVEILDPQQSPELEREAGEQYGIRPVAFQTASKYQAAVVNSYFDILVKYGDQYETLGFQDLIEVKVRGEMDLDVRLRHPEYDITRTIRKVLQGYQGGGDLFANLSKPLRLKAFVSAPDRLPDPLPGLRSDLESLLAELKSKSNGRFDFEIQDPAAGDGTLAKTIREQYGFEPLVVSLLNPTPFYFYLVLEDGARRVPVPLPESLDRADLNRSIESAIKRFAPGVLRTVALYAPTPAPDFGMGGGMSDDYGLLRQTLQDSFSLRETDLSSGQVPQDADLLLVIKPESLDEKQRFAIDQFLMQGGTLILAASSFDIDLGGGAISARKIDTGLNDWLAHHGLTLEPRLVLDPHNTPFPIPVQRNLGGFLVREIQTLAYPYFPDIRGEGLAEDSPITAGLGQITLNWSSPITLDATKNAKRRVTLLLQSSKDAWTSDSENMQPDFEAHGALGFPKGEDRGRKLLAVAIEGRFESAFAGRPSPLLTKDEAEAKSKPESKPESESDSAGQTQKQPVVSGVIDSSPESARLILIGSSSFLGNTAISLANEATQSRYLKPLELIQNAIDWSLEDPGLLSLRSQGQFGRLLDPIGRETRLFWETLNYLLALGGLLLVYALHRHARARRARYHAAILGQGGQ
ncbi:Gldg family protein [Thermochromatium tepidum]|uniref:ABC transporter permease subunit n=1 Tax=Thermochromatium tepidum ATCC 43061 TaxID=316276 RepID=A0A6I6DX10_THETI|nr:Gldg family protein [Thermochromatium tepidum]QGU32071.1 ABC transporter permease subunit [Thermochromatium tepidum ATCC 43061]